MRLKDDDSVRYSPLPSNPHPHPHPHPPAQNVVVVLPSYSGRRRRYERQCLLCSCAVFLSLLFLAAAIFFLYPSDPSIRVVRVRLNHIGVKTSPIPVLDLSFSLTVKVRNRDFFSLNYDSLIVSVGYRGRELGTVSSEGGRLKARGSSYMNATLDVNGFQVIHDVFYLLKDLAKGVIPFETHTRVKGELGLFFFNIPLKGTVSCDVLVNSDEQRIVRQDCYPESLGQTLQVQTWSLKNASKLSADVEVGDTWSGKIAASVLYVNHTLVNLY